MAEIAPIPAPTPAVDEVAGLARLAGAVVDQLTIPVRDTHRAVADRVFRAVGPVATPVRLVHDTVAGAVYASVRGGSRLIGAGAGTALAAVNGWRPRRSVSATPLGATGLAFASGLLGDWLEGRADDLIVSTTLTHHGRPVDVSDGGVGGVAAPTDRVVVFVHGLAETTGSWAWYSTDDDGAHVPTYGERLAEVGWTPLEVGYNTGRPVADSGDDLAALLDEVVSSWPVPVAEVALVGHSMGGLVVSAAAHRGLAEDHAWVPQTSHVVTLGTPHTGSWLAKGAAGAVRVLDVLPETRGLGGIIDLRSAGIRDLTHGWRPEPDPEAPDDEIQELAALLPGAKHAYVAATLGATEGHTLSRLLGDGLVHMTSSTAPSGAGGPNIAVRHHPGVGHIRLVHHPAVADDLVTGWSPGSAGDLALRMAQADGGSPSTWSKSVARVDRSMRPTDSLSQTSRDSESAVVTASTGTTIRPKASSRRYRYSRT